MRHVDGVEQCCSARSCEAVGSVTGEHSACCHATSVFFYSVLQDASSAAFGTCQKAIVCGISSCQTIVLDRCYSAGCNTRYLTRGRVRAVLQHPCSSATPARRRRAEQMVNLLTLNTLRCSRKDVTEGRLALTTARVEVRPTSEYDAAFLQHLLPSLEWDQLVAMALVVGVTLPAELNETLRGDDAFLRALHHVLFDVQVLEGSLCCSESGQVFPIAEGIADMMLPEAVV